MNDFAIELPQVRHTYDDEEVLHGIDLTIDHGEPPTNPGDSSVVKAFGPCRDKRRGAPAA